MVRVKTVKFTSEYKRRIQKVIHRWVYFSLRFVIQCCDWDERCSELRNSETQKVEIRIPGSW